MPTGLTTKPTIRARMVAHTVRTRDGGTKAIKAGRKQAILLMCVECLGWETHPRDCTSRLCPLYPYRGITHASQRSGQG